MKRWVIALLAVVAACLVVLLQHSASQRLLTDSDTVAMLNGIRARHNPWSWFVGDWPLANHFYRPVSTLTFEMDSFLYGNNPAGYGWTNALLCVGCILALFWFLREVTDHVGWSVSAALLFAAWHTPWAPSLMAKAIWLAPLVAVVGFLRHGLRLDRYVPAVAVLFYLVLEALAISDRGNFHMDVERWLPGRTASSMALFALLAMASLARAIRISNGPILPTAPGPSDPPATKSSSTALNSHGNPIGWVIVAVISAVFAFGCYEQAVMLPAVLVAVMAMMKLQGFRPKWAWLAPFWIIMVGYLAIRWAVLPHEVSQYQRQELRGGPTVAFALLRYLYPTAQSFWLLVQTLEYGAGIFIEPGPWITLAGFFGTAVGLIAVRKNALLAYSSLALSFLAFMPMAWVKAFAHYDYWPFALRSLFVVALAVAAARLTASAWSPRVRQAPARPSPAPGSLPRR